MAARYTDERRDNFGICWAAWVVRYKTQIFGRLFVIGLVYAAFRWWAHAAADER